jgi:flagellar basal-body rod protein FlgB
VLQKILQAANVRQKVIASNIANADTPGYKAKDVKFNNLVSKELKLLTTDPKHMHNGGGSDVGAEVVSEDSLSWGDSNNVEMNLEVAKMTENALTHNAAVRILNSKIRMYKAAIKGGG